MDNPPWNPTDWLALSAQHHVLGWHYSKDMAELIGHVAGDRSPLVVRAALVDDGTIPIENPPYPPRVYVAVGPQCRLVWWGYDEEAVRCKAKALGYLTAVVVHASALASPQP